MSVMGNSLGYGLYCWKQLYTNLQVKSTTVSWTTSIIWWNYDVLQIRLLMKTPRSCKPPLGCKMKSNPQHQYGHWSTRMLSQWLELLDKHVPHTSPPSLSDSLGTDPPYHLFFTKLVIWNKIETKKMRIDIVCLYFVSRYKEEVILYLVLVVECHSKDHQLFLKSPKFDKPPQQVYE